jgi:hypothetical protein
MSDDDLGAVIRGHLYVEAAVNRLIDAMLPFPQELSDSRLGWPQRVDLALALGLKAQYGSPLKKIGQIRNKFAHRPDASLDDKDVSGLYDSLDAEDRDIVLESFRRTQTQAPEPLQAKFNELTPKDRFTLLMVTLHSILLVAIAEVTKKPIGTC